MYTETEMPIAVKEKAVFLSKLRGYLDQEIHLKVEGDEGPNLYVLKEVNKDCLVVYAAQFRRIVPIKKIVFVQINDAPIGAKQWKKKVSF